MDHNPEILTAAKEVYSLVVNHYHNEDGIHVGTVVAAAARLAGTSLFRSFHFNSQNIPPGQVILSEEANEEGPKLVGVLLGTLKANGIEIDGSKMVIQPNAPHAPQQDLLQVQKELQEDYNRIMTQHKLDFVQAAFAGAVASALVIRETRNTVDPHITAGIAAYGFIEGTKTAPLPLQTGRD